MQSFMFIFYFQVCTIFVSLLRVTIFISDDTKRIHFEGPRWEFGDFFHTCSFSVQPSILNSGQGTVTNSMMIDAQWMICMLIVI